MSSGIRSCRPTAARGALAAGLAAALALAGCSVVMGSKKAVEGGQSPPVYRVGDSLTFEEQGEETAIFVTAVEDDQLTWTDNAGNKWVTSRDPMIPPRAEMPKSGGPSVLRFFEPQSPTVFPLAPNKKVQYTVTVSRTGEQPRFERQSCEEHAPHPLTVEAGTFDAWEIVCRRGGVRETLYYAPAVGAVLLRQRETPKGVERVTLADFHRAQTNGEAAGGAASAKA
ncbi:MAG: hypothetical protein EPO42_14825, partial [Gallionellaceae bacterium]